MQTMKTGTSKQSNPRLFLVLAFGITWLFWIPPLVIADKRGYVLPVIANFNQLLDTGFENPQHIFLSTLFSLAVYGPLVAAVIVTAVESGRAGLADLLAGMLKWRVHVKWYAVLAGLAVALTVVPGLAGRLAGPVQPAIVWTAPLLVGLFLWQLVTSGLGEEPGWRGYLLPYLRDRYGSDRTVWLLGITWAAWHYPFTIYDTLSKTGGLPAAGVMITVVMALAGQTMSLVGMTYLYVWLYNNTGSVFIAIVFHALSNFLPAVLLSGMNSSLGILAALMPWIVVFMLEKALGKDRFPGKWSRIEYS
ncbi:MAG: CPBP family intramembrane metalloprotease [Anaerolineales bacterium]|nr:CPBP family intramembrane metalloprotease [Anaerolineales bacterium]